MHAGQLLLGPLGKSSVVPGYYTSAVQLFLSLVIWHSKQSSLCDSQTFSFAFSSCMHTTLANITTIIYNTWTGNTERLYIQTKHIRKMDMKSWIKWSSNKKIPSKPDRQTEQDRQQILWINKCFAKMKSPFVN